MHIFHSRENIKACIFKIRKIQDLIFSRERNRKIGTTFFLFSQYGLKEATLLMHICFFTKGNNKQKVRVG